MTNPFRDNETRGRGGALALALAGLTTGCVSQQPAPTPAGPPPPAPVASPLPAAPAALFPKASAAVYRNPKIAMVYLRAHQDADGRLLGPQIMYQVSEPGGWNVEAVDQGKAYIPAVNLEIPPGQGSPYVVPASEVPPTPARAALLDPGQAGQIILTGLMHREDQVRADALAREAGPGRTAAFDPEAGWIVLPGRRPEPDAPATRADQDDAQAPPAADDSTER